MQNNVTLFAAMTLLVFASPMLADTNVPDEVRAMVGEYRGEFTSYGIDKTGKVTEKMSWTDVLVAKTPKVEADRAFVSFTNPMTARGADKPHMTVTGKEGYTLKADGEVADYFIEMFGQTYTAKKLSDNVWAYSMPAHPRELAAYGFSNVVSGEHVMVKVQTNENGILNAPYFPRDYRKLEGRRGKIALDSLHKLKGLPSTWCH